jgi:nicotinamide mononucleotide transporter
MIIYGAANYSRPVFIIYNKNCLAAGTASVQSFTFEKNTAVSLAEIYQQFISDIHKTTWLEYIAVFTGIASVWFSRIENILVYPVGLINTVIYIYLSIKGQLLGEASVNLYYTIMSIYGWLLWMKKDETKQQVVHVAFSDKRWWAYQLLFFAAFYLAIFIALTYLKKSFADGVIPWADAFASATAFTGMWLMTKKKVESWYWWLATNIASVPLYFVKHYVFTSVYYVVLFVMAVLGLLEWMKRARANTVVLR